MTRTISVACGLRVPLTLLILVLDGFGLAVTSQGYVLDWVSGQDLYAAIWRKEPNAPAWRAATV